MSKLSSIWNASYERGDNLLFSPNEEIVRFVSSFIRKRIGPEDHKNLSPLASLTALDLGCGAGRHVIYLAELGFDVIGADHSEIALQAASNWVEHVKRSGKVFQGNIKLVKVDSTSLELKPNSIGFVIAHGVLDSMPASDAMQTCRQLQQCVVPGGLVYADFISMEDSSFKSSSTTEVVVQGSHEHGTIQSYFDIKSIEETFGIGWEIVKLYSRQTLDLQSKGGNRQVRIHVVAKKI